MNNPQQPDSSNQPTQHITPYDGGQTPMNLPPQQQQYPPQQQQYPPQQAAAAPTNIVIQNQVGAQGGMVRVANRTKGVAMLLALFFGGFGVHKFYLGEGAKGAIYLLFFWTFIPAILAWIDIFSIAFQSQQQFDMKYNVGLG